MPGPLAGVRILDLTAVISGPSATMLLADQGADVIKVENPKAGDLTRYVATKRGGFSAAFVNNNRNKRSLGLNLKDPKAVEALKALAKTCDVVVQNFRPGVVDRLGIGEAAMRLVKPDIIYVSISGFGEDGPFSQKPVYDPLVQALSGLTTVQAGNDEDRPRLIRTIVPDKLTGMAAAQAITAALFHYAKTGEGQHVKVNMLDTILAFLWGSDMGGHTFVGDELPKETAQSFIDLVYETQTDFITVAVNNDKQWRNLIRAFDKPEWLEDPRFTTPQARSENINIRLGLIQHVLMTNTADHWLAHLDRHDVPCAPVLTRREAIRHPQVEANKTLIYSDHPEAGPLRQSRPAATFSKTPTDIRMTAPVMAAHNAEILREAGLSEEDIEGLIP